LDKWASISNEVRQYLLVTFNYWAFTLTDGALRMLVVLYFYQLGYSPLDVALLFLFYELFGVITNLLGGWLGAYVGLNSTMNAGLLIQVVALSMLLLPQDMLTVAWVMAAQALSGIAKDLNKMSAKSAIKTLLPANAKGALYKWVAILTGSKNALKGVGFFVGGVLLTVWGFREAILIMAMALVVVWLFSIVHLDKNLGKSLNKPKLGLILAKSRAVNTLSAARLFLFGARDVWFVVALPVYLLSEMEWSESAVGAFLASWVIGYGIVQSIAPRITGYAEGQVPDGRTALMWALALSCIPALIAIALADDLNIELSLTLGLLVFGGVFAVNSAVHSYLIVSYAESDGASLDVGFYYMANAMGRLLGTVLSGWIYQEWGLISCLWLSSVFIAIAAAISVLLPRNSVSKSLL
jgi:predicted MFS family arabinose efflux permease